jgi:pilus assembly protein Flp/PilA
MGTRPEVELKTREISQLTPCGEEDNMDLIIKFALDEMGAPAVEYAIILALLGIGIMSGITAIGDALNNVFASLAAKITTSG